ncbi:MAG: SUMF1/EgtB/PvdO family nonheme iron enzyme, partial [Saprospiraceae bacterium]
NWRHDEGGRPRSQSPGAFGTYPVLHVSWNDAARYCNWLSGQANLQAVYNLRQDTVSTNFSANGYRLPTEAEWEYAAAAGKAISTQPFAGLGSLNALAWYSGNSHHRVHLTARKKANALGVYDLSGNVWEWCQDWYDPRFYEKSSGASDPCGPPNGQERTLRGGSWNNNPAHCRIANRSSRYADFRDGSVGFRVARR